MPEVFKYAPRIQWKTCNKIIQPEIEESELKKFFYSKIANLYMQEGGILENFLALSFYEYLSKNLISQNFYWDGQDRFNFLVEMQGLGKIAEERLSFNESEKYLTPIFNWKESPYLNPMRNYLEVYNTDYKYTGRGEGGLISRMRANLLFPWDNRYIPRFRNTGWWEWKEEWNRDFMLIIPERTGYSMHKESYCNWGPVQIKGLASRAKLCGLKIMVVSDQVHPYVHENIIVLPKKMGLILQAVEKAEVIFSKDIDYVYLGQIYGNKMLVGNDQAKHQYFIGTNPWCYVKPNIDPQILLKKFNDRRQY